MNANSLKGMLAILLVAAVIPSARGQWRIDRVDSDGEVARMGTAVALDSTDRPLLLYPGYFRMKLARWLGSGWSIETVDSVYSGYPSVATAGEAVHLAYYDGTSTGDLLYTGPAGVPSGVLDTEGDVGRWTSLALSSQGHPCLSYRDNTHGDLKYAAFDGVGWRTERVEGSGQSGLYTSLALDPADQPHIGFYNSSDGTLRYAHREGVGWTVEILVAQGGTHPSVAWGPQGLHWVYYDGLAKALVYRGPPGFPTGQVDDEGDVGKWCSLALDSLGWPHVSYHEETQGDLKYAYYDEDHWEIQVVDTEMDVGLWSSLALDSESHAHISYLDQSAMDLKYAYHITGPGPRPSATPTPHPGTPTPTPEAVWYRLEMQDQLLEPGELFLLERLCGNPADQPLEVIEYIVLDVDGDYWLWPSWTQQMDNLPWELTLGTSYVDSILEFVWPSGFGGMMGIRFWGGFVAPGSGELILYDMIEWGFAE